MVWAGVAHAAGGARGGRVRFSPGELATTLAELDDAVVRPRQASRTCPTREASPADARAGTVAHRGELDPRGVLAA